jgi:sugar lactone lactonase YvrE
VGREAGPQRSEAEDGILTGTPTNPATTATASLRGRVLCALMLALACVWPAAAAAAPSVTEFTGGVTAGFSANGQPFGIAAGPDGNLWFTEENSPGRVARITPAGVVTEFTGGVTAGFSANGQPIGIAAGPDGNLWFTELNNPGRVARITPAGVVTEFTGGVTAGFSANGIPFGIAAGPDGNLWFTEENSPGRVARITPAGVVTEFAGGVTAGFSANGSPTGIAAGPDGNLWFNEGANPGRVARITLGPGAVTPPAGGGGAAGPSPPAKASFAGSKSSITVSRKRSFKFSFRATPGLTGTAVFESVKKVRLSRKQKVTLAKKSFRVPASGKVTLRIKLSKKKFRILKLNRKIRTSVTVTLKNTAGLTSKASKKLTVKAPKPKRRRR